MNNTTEADAAGRDFDWEEPIPGTTLINIAMFGDTEMRLAAAANPSLDSETATALLALGDPKIAAVLRKNPAASKDIRSKAAWPRKSARVARRAAKRAEKRAHKSRKMYISQLQAVADDVR